MCHFTPNRKVQRKPPEVKDTQRFLQARLEKAEGLLRQAGLAGYGRQTSPSTTGLNANFENEPAQGLVIGHYTPPASLTGDFGITVHQLPEDTFRTSQNRLQDNSGSPFQHHIEAANNSNTIDTNIERSRTSPHANGFVHGAVTVNYPSITRPPIISPTATQFVSTITPVTSNEPEPEPAVCDACVMRL